MKPLTDLDEIGLIPQQVQAESQIDGIAAPNPQTSCLFVSHIYGLKQLTRMQKTTSCMHSDIVHILAVYKHPQIFHCNLKSLVL